MQEAVPVGEGAMAAVMKAEADVVTTVCAEVAGEVQPANYNSPGQIVISGAKLAVQEASAKLKAKGARVVPLKVSAPFHSALMKPAEDRLAPHLAEAGFDDPSVPVYCNVDAVAVTRADTARDALKRQVSRPVRWEETIRRMVDDGATLFVEIGPGRVLTGLIRRIASDVERLSVESVEDLEPARARIRAVRA